MFLHGGFRHSIVNVWFLYMIGNDGVFIYIDIGMYRTQKRNRTMMFLPVKGKLKWKMKRGKLCVLHRE